MDYPSDPTVGLVNGKFTDGDPAAAIAPSRDPAEWANAVTDEIVALIQLAGLVPDENNVSQMAEAVLKIVQAAAQHYQGSVSGPIPDGAVRINKATGVLEEYTLATTSWAPLPNPAQFVLKRNFPNVSAPANPTQTELNILVGLTRTAAQLNTIGRGCLAYRDTGLLVNSGVSVDFTLPSEQYDTDGFHSTDTNTHRITIPAGVGAIRLRGSVSFGGLNPAPTDKGVQAVVYKNGVTLSPQLVIGKGSYSDSINSDMVVNFQSPRLVVAENDYFYIRVAQRSGQQVSLYGWLEVEVVP